MKNFRIKLGKMFSFIKAGVVIIAFIVALILLILSLISIGKDKKIVEDKLSDSVKFKNEYEKVNGKTNESDKTYPEVNISEKNEIKYSDYNEVINVITSGTGVIYLGYETCPWCRNSVPLLLQAAENTNLDKIYYINIKNDRDVKILENGDVKTEKEGTEGYNNLLKALGETASIYNGLNDDSIKRIYAPTVIFVKNGVVQSLHVSTVDSQTDPYIPMTSLQRQELYNIYLNGILNIKDSSCDDAC